MNEQILKLIDEIEMHCPCGARPESLNTHPHVGGCPVAELKRLLKMYSAQRPTSGSVKSISLDLEDYQ